MKRWLWVLGFLGIVALIAFVLANSQVKLSLQSNNETSLKVETSFPNASCSKTLSRDFPFAVISCAETSGLVNKTSDDGLSEKELPELKP